MDESTDAPGEQALAPLPTPSRPTRRRALWGVLAVLAVGAGTLAVTGIDDADPPRLPISLGAADGRAEGGATPAAADRAMSMLASQHYVAGDDLPLLGGEGPAYRLPGKVDEAAFRKVATALGLEGRVERADGMWHLRDGDASLDASDGAGGSWWFTADAGPRTDGGAGDAGTSSSGGGSSASEPMCPPDATPESCKLIDVDPDLTPTTLAEPPADCTADEKCVVDPAPPFVPPADLPTKDEARSIALEALGRTGFDLAGADVQVEGPYDGWMVSVQPRLGGLATSGRYLSATVGPKGALLYASGSFPGEERLGTYPTLDTRKAIDRLNEQGSFAYVDVARSATGTAEGSAEAAEGGADVGGDAPITTTTLSAPDTAHRGDGCALVDPAATDQPLVSTTVPGGAEVTPAYDPCGRGYESPAPVDVVLHGAERILTLTYANDGSTDAYLVPGYRFTGDDGVVVEVASVDDASLAPVAPPAPTEPPVLPEPQPGDTGGVSTMPCRQPEPGPDGAVPDICLTGPVTADLPPSTAAAR